MNNLLNIALSVQDKFPLGYSQFTGNTIASNGEQVPAYATTVTVYGSFQPVSRNLYDQLGLEFQKNYAWIYVSQDVTDIGRDAAGDQFTFSGQTWQVLSKTQWAIINGWDAILTVQITNT